LEKLRKSISPAKAAQRIPLSLGKEKKKHPWTRRVGGLESEERSSPSKEKKKAPTHSSWGGKKKKKTAKSYHNPTAKKRVKRERKHRNTLIRNKMKGQTKPTKDLVHCQGPSRKRFSHTSSHGFSRKKKMTLQKWKKQEIELGAARPRVGWGLRCPP